MIAYIHLYVIEWFQISGDISRSLGIIKKWETKRCEIIHSWKLGKLEIVWKHFALRASCFHTISSFPNFHSCLYNCISTRKMFNIC
jgi:hypothetical protein